MIGNLLYRKYVKRVLDVLFSFLLLLLLFPFLIFVALLIIVTSKGPLFFTQIRVGKDLKNFRVYKFRTMTDRVHEVKKIFGKTEDVTTVGYYLRRYKIDELPQLFNVLMGDMSLIGPRPSIPDQLSTMNREQKRRYSVRPGITGLAQVSGNIYLDWVDRFKLDLQYVDNISLFNDLKIVIRTISLIIAGEDKYLDKPLKIHPINEDT